MTTEASMRATSSTMWMRTGGARSRSISVSHLQHFFGEGEAQKQVLFDNNLDVYEGEIVIMTGRSGSGKTTLLTLIGTLRTVQEGNLRVLGKELHGASPEELIAARLNIGFIFQAHNLFGSLTALQNVRMGLELFNFSRAEMKRRATTLLERLDLGHRLNYRPRSLSGGQKQRVAIARGLAHGPRIVLADEPTAALDPESVEKVIELFREVAREQGTTLLIVTHDNRISKVADRIVNMVDGYIKSDVVLEESAHICEFLQKLRAFEKLSTSTLASIADKMLAHQHAAGEVIVRQGEVGDKFYLIRSGEVEVMIDDGTRKRVVATLRENNFFGEQALITGEPRNATITTTRPTLLYSLDKEQFQAALAGSDSLREELQKVLFERQ